MLGQARLVFEDDDSRGIQHKPGAHSSSEDFLDPCTQTGVPAILRHITPDGSRFKNTRSRVRTI